MADFVTLFREFVKSFLIKGCNMREITLRTLRERYLVHTGRDGFDKLEKSKMKSVVLEELQKYLSTEPTQSESDDGNAPTSLSETPKATRDSQQIVESPHQGNRVSSSTTTTARSSKPKIMSAEQAVDALIGKSEDDVDAQQKGCVRKMAARSSPRTGTPTRVPLAVRESSPSVRRAKKRLSSDHVIAEIANNDSDSDGTGGVDQQEGRAGNINEGCSNEIDQDVGDDEDTDIEGCSNEVEVILDKENSDVPMSDTDVSDDGSFIEWRPVKKNKKVVVESDDAFEMDRAILISPRRKKKDMLNEIKTATPMSKGKSPGSKGSSYLGVSLKKRKQKKGIREKVDKDLVQNSSDEEFKTSLRKGDNDANVPMGYYVGTVRKECKVVLEKLNIDSHLSAVSFYKNKRAASSSRAKSDKIVKRKKEYGRLQKDNMEDDYHSSDTDVGDVTKELVVNSSKDKPQRKSPRKGVAIGVGGGGSSSSDDEPLPVLKCRNSPGKSMANSAEHSSSDDGLLFVDKLRNGKSPRELLRERRASRRKSERKSTVLNESYTETVSSDSDTDLERMCAVKYRKKTKKSGGTGSSSCENKRSSAVSKGKQSAPKDPGCKSKLGQGLNGKRAVMKGSYAETLSSDEDGEFSKKHASERPRRESPRKAVMDEKVTIDNSSDSDVVDVTPKKGAAKKMRFKDKKDELSASDSDTDVKDVTPKKDKFVKSAGKRKLKDSSAIMSKGNKNRFSETDSDTDVGDIVLIQETFPKDSRSPRKPASSAKKGQADHENLSDDEVLSNLRSGKPHRNPPLSSGRSSPRKTAHKSYIDSSSSDSDELPDLTPMKTDPSTIDEQQSAKKDIGKYEDIFTLSSDEEPLKALIGRKSPRKQSPRINRRPSQVKSQKSKRKAVSSSDSDEEPLTVIKKDHSTTKKTSLNKGSKKEKSLQESSDLDSSLDVSDSEIIPLKSSDESKKARKKDTSSHGVKRKRTQDSSQESGSARGPKKKAAKVDKDGSVERQYKLLVQVSREAGLFVHYRAMKNMSEEKKITFLKKALEEAGMKGRPTMEKAQELKLRREAAELNVGNIISPDSGNSKRSSRSRSQTTSSRPALKPQTPAKKKFSRLADIIDSEGSSE